MIHAKWGTPIIEAQHSHSRYHVSDCIEIGKKVFPRLRDFVIEGIFINKYTGYMVLSLVYGQFFTGPNVDHIFDIYRDRLKSFS